MKSIKSIAEKFRDAFYNRSWRGALEPSISGLSIEEAYLVQDYVAAMRVELGESIVGYKVGCTSTRIQQQFGLGQPIFARLFRPHIYSDGMELDWTNYVNCAIEPELVIKIGVDLYGPEIADEALIDAIEWVSAGIELHHFRFWFSPPSSQELICSGGIHAGLVIGKDKVSPKVLSFKEENFFVYKNGELITQGTSSEIMGSPLISLKWLLKKLHERGLYLKKGDLVIPGSPVELVAINEETDLKVEIDGVGEVGAYFREKKRK